MVLLTLSKKVNQWMGPFMLKHGLKVQALLSGGSSVNDKPYLDSIAGLPWAKYIISLEVRDAGDQAVAKARGDANSSWWMGGNDTSRGLGLFDSPDNKHKQEPTTSSGGLLSLEDESSIRLDVLESYVRSALVPNEKWSDVQEWQFNSRLIMWARKEYLLAKHRAHLKAAFEAFPSLRSTKQFWRKQRTIAKLLSGNLPWQKQQQQQQQNNSNSNNQQEQNNNANATKLPKTSTIKRVFGMQKWAEVKKDGARRKRMGSIAKILNGGLIELRGGGWSIADIPEDANLSELSLGEILELARGHVETCGPFNALCEEADIFQLWTQEYVNSLAQYILKRAQHYEGQTVVLEVGAGDGLLAESLREYFENNIQSSARNKAQKRQGGIRIPHVVATDDYTWAIFRRANVERLGYEQALNKYCGTKKNDISGGVISSSKHNDKNDQGNRQPRNDDDDDRDRQVIVICSWMPMAEDWSAAFRKNQVEEYILIGECDDGQCGDNWETWGNIHMFSDDVKDELQHIMDNKNDDNSSSKIEPFQPPMVTPPYKNDQYIRKNLETLLPFQLSRYDSSLSRSGRTVSFRRQSSR
eukprot:CAMPEP_0198148452 /NCGR_PEP_ID=MMETSP1443-20131203/41448_1 /TAXON_ID=186043 /ORGANISM="Entomoneis sp., Strain CCMP2396" /LENGTH=582 /DNA_ID=CAMNT_0043813139 /DNA_START=205 /DNA_END=1953 /DNA_ORIENTATION=+